MVAVQNPEIRKAVNTLYELSADERTRAEYEMHMRAVRDRAWLRQDGYEEGWQIGQQAGRQEGLQIGLRKTQELARLIKSGKSPDEAMSILGLDDSFE